MKPYYLARDLYLYLSLFRLEPFRRKKIAIDTFEMPLPLLGSSSSRCNCGGIIFEGNKRNRTGPLPGHLVHGNLGYTKDTEQSRDTSSDIRRPRFSRGNDRGAVA